MPEEFGIATYEEMKALLTWWRETRGSDTYMDKPAEMDAGTPSWYFVKFDEDLDQATNALTGYTQAQATVVKYTSTDDLDRQVATGSIVQVTVTNRLEDFSASSGQYTWVKKVRAEWVPFNPSSGAIKPGKVLSCIGDGIYTVELTEPITVILSSVNTGTGSSIDDNCDPCRSGLNIQTCEVVLPSGRAPGTGKAQIVYAWDKSNMILKVGGACSVTLEGHTIQTEDSSGSGTGSAATTEPLYTILTAERELIKIKDSEYECCANGVVLETLRRYHLVPGCTTEDCTMFSCPDSGTGSA